MAVIELMTAEGAGGVVGFEDLLQNGKGLEPAHADYPNPPGAWGGGNGGDSIVRLVFSSHYQTTFVSLTILVRGFYSFSLFSVVGLLLLRLLPRDEGRFFGLPSVLPPVLPPVLGLPGL